MGSKIRACDRPVVALDYLYVMSGIEGKGGLGKDGAIEPPLRFKASALIEKNGRLEVLLSDQLKKLDCITGVRIWVFEKTGIGSRAVRQWNVLKPTLMQGAAEKTLVFSGEEIVALTRCLKGQDSLWSTIKAFCEVRLKEPKKTEAGEDWAKDMQCTDPWVFPLEIMAMGGATPAASIWSMSRPQGEFGEVPDWDWLYETWGETSTATGNRYPKAKDVILNKSFSGSRA